MKLPTYFSYLGRLWKRNHKLRILSYFNKGEWFTSFNPYDFVSSQDVPLTYKEARKRFPEAFKSKKVT